MKIRKTNILIILLMLACNKPHNMVNGNAANQDQQPQLSEDESVSPPTNITGAYLACQPNRELGQEVLSIDLKCGLETSDGDKVDGNKIGLKWQIEHNEEDVNVTSVERDDYDVVYEFRSTRKGQIVKVFTNGNILISAADMKDIRTNIVYSEKKTIAELGEEFSRKDALKPTPPQRLCQGGVLIGGGCWYYGDQGASCSEVCEGRGGYNSRTETYANNRGINKLQCVQILNSLILRDIDQGKNLADYSSLRLGGYVLQKYPYLYEGSDRKTGCATYYGDLPGKWVDISAAEADASYPQLKEPARVTISTRNNTICTSLYKI